VGKVWEVFAVVERGQDLQQSGHARTVADGSGCSVGEAPGGEVAAGAETNCWSRPVMTA